MHQIISAGLLTCYRKVIVIFVFKTWDRWGPQVSGGIEGSGRPSPEFYAQRRNGGRGSAVFRGHAGLLVRPSATL